MTALDCVNACRGSFIKARRLYMKVHNWRDTDWYREWPHAVGAEWEAAAVLWWPQRP